MRINDLGMCVLQGNGRVFINEFTKASIVAGLLKAGPNNLHNTKGVTTRPRLLSSHVSVSCAKYVLVAS
jgi:hypothetical protein